MDERNMIVTTTSGKVRGYEKDGVISFLGIPYAKPPVGELRFKRAQPIEPWDGIYDAKEFGNMGIQLDRGQYLGSEDCLFLNVQRPAEGENLPVLIWIHGGGYNTGNPQGDGLQPGEHFVQDGIVYASLQYRLNVLGFYDFTTYPGCEDFDSNCGLSDQILALQWLHENIAAFGGDPNRVTIMGESAGGASVINMLAAPAVKGCFQQAIAESGLPNCVMSHQMARENIDLFLEGMGWTEADLPKLRTIDPFELMKGNSYVGEKHQYKNPGMFLPGPVIDDLLPVRPIDAIRSGSADGVKLIIGNTLHEGTMFVHPENTGFPNSWAMVAEMLEKNGHADAIPAIIAYYHPTVDDRITSYFLSSDADLAAKPPVMNTAFRREGGDPFIEFATDYAFQMPALKVGEGQRQYADVWMFRYELVTKSGIETGWKASHAFELPCVFKQRNHPFADFVFDGESDATFRKICDDIHTPWVNFIKNGEPDPENWPKYEGYNSPVRIFDRRTRTEQLNRTPLMEVWGDLRFYEG